VLQKVRESVCVISNRERDCVLNGKRERDGKRRGKERKIIPEKVQLEKGKVAEQ
jgi:hypothetical protein